MGDRAFLPPWVPDEPGNPDEAALLFNVHEWRRIHEHPERVRRYGGAVVIAAHLTKALENLARYYVPFLGNLKLPADPYFVHAVALGPLVGEITWDERWTEERERNWAEESAT